MLYQDAPSWSPDGQWIAFNESDGKGSFLRKIRVGSKEAVTLTNQMAGNTFSQTQWSPDGRVIACQLRDGLSLVSAETGDITLLNANEVVLQITWAPDGRSLFALTESEEVGHFQLIELDVASKQIRVLNADLGIIPVANQPIRGFSYLPGQGFLTSLASARSDVWLLEGFQPPASWMGRILGRLR